MNQLQPFARGSSSAVATAGGPLGPSLQRGSSATLNHVQMLPHGSGGGSPSEMGELVSHAATPVRVHSVRVQGRGVSSAIRFLNNWGRLRSARLFDCFAGLSRCNGIRPADRYGSRNHLFRHVAELLCQFGTSVRCGATTPREASDYVPHTIGEVRNV